MKYVLGIDTSNYTTSVSIIDRDFKIIEDQRTAIRVREGMKGIRQSEALFQHLENLPDMLEGVLLKYASELEGVCVSSRPRPVTGSYMPVFKAGVNAGKLISDSLNIPLIMTSHQEGHIEAGKYPENGEFEPDSISNDVLAVFHLSGGTTEILLGNEIIGGSKDISFGQVVDRMGVAAGFAFPAGAELDQIALAELEKAGSYDKIKEMALKEFKYISKDGLMVNLSGLDSQIKRLAENKTDMDEKKGAMIAAVFYLISHCLKTLTMDLKKQYNVSKVLFVGGVSSSSFIKNYLTGEKELNDIKIHFGRPGLSVDNAVGVAIIGGRELWL